jgi:hypothetical protein
VTPLGAGDGIGRTAMGSRAGAEAGALAADEPASVAASAAAATISRPRAATARMYGDSPSIGPRAG